MKVLSLFDGIACARVALERAGISVEAYFASEIDKYAVEVAKKNYPDIVELGDIKTIGYADGQFCRINERGEYNTLGADFHEDIDLMIGGSPCQDLSIAKKDRKGLKGERSGLFYEYIRLLKEVKPRWFILENVASMPKESRELITHMLGVEPIMIDAALVSAQRRRRLFWTNIPGVLLPSDRGIYLKDILEDIPIGQESVYQYRRSYWRKTDGGKVPTLTANMGTGGNNVPYVVTRARGKNKGGVVKGGKAPTLTSSGYEDNTRVVVALTERRTEEAKKIRRDMRKKTGKDFSPRRAKELVPRTDGKANTLTTGVTKESLVMVIPKPVALRNRGKGKKPEYNGTQKANALTTVHTDSMVDMPPIRKLTPVECERLQSLPDNYTEGVSNTRRYHALGNAFNVEVVAHILKAIPQK